MDRPGVTGGGNGASQGKFLGGVNSNAGGGNGGNNGDGGNGGDGAGGAYSGGAGDSERRGNCGCSLGAITYRNGNGNNNSASGGTNGQSGNVGSEAEDLDQCGGPFPGGAYCKAFDCDDLGTTTTTLSIVDKYGRSESCTVSLTVNNGLLPELFCDNVFLNFPESVDTSITLDLYSLEGTEDNWTFSYYSAS